MLGDRALEEWHRVLGEPALTRIHSGFLSTSPGSTFTGMRDSFAAAFCLAPARYVSTGCASRTTSLELIVYSSGKQSAKFLAQQRRGIVPGGAGP